MAMFNTPKDVLDRVSQLREDHAAIRVEVAARTALGIQYSNGKQWTNVAANPLGNVWVDTWDEDWDPKSTDIRVVDNKTGPLVRRIAASTNATKIEATVNPPRHAKGFEVSNRAAVSQDILNALEDSMNLTRAARAASSLRWRAGSSLLLLMLSKKKSRVPPEVARFPDGSPIEINDKWVRWDYGPLSELIWEPSNVRTDLREHTTLVVERVYSVKKFQQLYGPLDDFGLELDQLPTMGEIAPHYVHAAELAGASLFSAYRQHSQEKGLRVATLYESDPNDPTAWPLVFDIVDTSSSGDLFRRISGKVINFDDPVSPYGHRGRPVFKLDAFARDDAVLAFGAPHVLMSDQDRLNMLRSIQFQQLAAVVHGMWLVDKQAADRDEFANDLAVNIGGVLSYDGRNGSAQVPQFVTPTAPNQQFITAGAEITQGMRDQVHITAANLGVGKTHIPQQIQQQLFQEAAVVVDNITARDADEYADALTATLGTVRRTFDGPNRMIARLRDRHGFGASDLQSFLEVDPNNVNLDVRVRRESITSRSIDDRDRQMMTALETQAISPKQYAIAQAEELERPIIDSHERQLTFCRKAVRDILNGFEWPGMPHLDVEIFIHTAEQAMWGLDLKEEDDRQSMARIQQAVMVQKQLSMENQMPVDPGAQGQVASNGQSGALPGPAPGGPSSSPLLSSGAPESVNPLTSPIGASGGLPLGLPASLS